MKNHARIEFAFLNVGHFLDHLFMLVFATVAALRLSSEWNLSYAELIPYATPSFVAFGLFALPAGWFADKWSRQGMMLVFFIGIGVCAIATAWADTPFQIGVGLFTIGLFAAIYHPVGIAMVVQGRTRTGIPLAVNGVYGNLGVACAALITGFVLDVAGWRAAFVLPGVLSMVIGAAYACFLIKGKPESASTAAKASAAGTAARLDARMLARVFAIIFFSTAVGGLIFQSTTFALPKVFDERLTDLADTATAVGGYAFLVFAIAAVGQLVVGYLLDNQRARTVFMAVAALQMILFTVMQSLTGVAALLVSIAFMFVVFGQIPINDVLVGRMTRSEWRSRVFALRYIVTISVMAGSVPLIAWIHSNWGFDKLFTVLAFAAGLILLAVSALPTKGLEPTAIAGRPAASPSARN